jgi:hypothetical protein
VRLHEQGLIYRGQRLVNWDPVLKTAISDLEVVSEEEERSAVVDPLSAGGRRSYDYVERDADGNETLRETRDYLVVATTRPETMLGDTAVMVHPEDALPQPDRQDRELPLTGSRDSDHRRRLRRQGLRHRRGQGHARARLQRLRGRPAPWPADDQHLHARRGESSREHRRKNIAAWIASTRAS